MVDLPSLKKPGLGPAAILDAVAMTTRGARLLDRGCGVVASADEVDSCGGTGAALVSQLAVVADEFEPLCS
jgi:hypothetical protein